MKKKKKLLTDFIDLMKEWDWEKNNEINLDPTKITHGSKTYAYWKCKNGHSWHAKIANRTILNRNCPICSKKIGGSKKSTPPIEKSLLMVNPKLVEEWHPTKNNDLDPSKIYPNAKKLVWWKCRKGHEYQAYVYSRNNGTGCSLCQKELHSSFPEKCLFFYLLKHFHDTKSNYKADFLNNMELDIYIPSLNIGFEYDGDKWHTDLKHDIEKNMLCENNKTKLVRIREKCCPIDKKNYNYVSYFHLKDYSKKELNKVIAKILNTLGILNVNVDIERDTLQIINLLEKQTKENSITTQYPFLSKEWDYDKNKDIKPDVFTPGSPTKVWWICSNGHSYPASIAHRVEGNGCPYCAGKKVYIGFNDLQSQHPELAKEWHPKNTLKPTEITSGYSKKVWWICPEGHEYYADPKHRVNGTGCSVCSGKKIIAGINDFATLRPELLKEWHPTKNLPLLPTQVSKSSGTNVWWLCKVCGHEWQARINKRVSGNGCPKCYERKRKGK